MKCKNHTKSEADMPTIAGTFCKECAEQIRKAQSTVDRHVSPKECFIIYENRTKGWQSFTSMDNRNTGCAHWVAHERTLKGGYSNVCAAGFMMKVRDVMNTTRRKVDREEVKSGDLWVNERNDHAGLVCKVEEIKVVVKEDGKDVEKTKNKITIRHCSSGQGGVVTNDFDRHWGGKGSFYRW